MQKDESNAAQNLSYSKQLKEIFGTEPDDYAPEYVISGRTAARTYLQPAALTVIPEPRDDSNIANFSDGYEPEYDVKSKFGDESINKTVPRERDVYKASLFITLCMLIALAAILCSRFF